MRKYDNPEVLNSAEWSLLENIVGLLFPSEPDGLGAVEAGVVRYIDGVLAARAAYLVDCYRAGFAWLHREAEHRGAARFQDLSRPVQASIVDDAMARAIAASLPLDTPSGAIDEEGTLFMTVVWQHTREGLFGDPRHGGNRDGMIWKWLGYSGPQLNGYTESEILENHTPSRPLRFAEDWKGRRV